MRTRLSRLAGAASVLLALALPAAAQAAASYYPPGPQTGVARSMVTAGGWNVCYSGDYTDNASLSTILADCDGQYLMLAGAIVGDPNYMLLAAAPRADVLHEAGQQTDGSVLSNGSQWYFNDSYSWGFAKGGDPVSRMSCDYDNDGQQPNGDLRLCWHTNAGSLYDGYRLGNDTFPGADHQRMVLEASGPNAVGSPDPLVFADQTQSTVSERKTVTYDVSVQAGAPDADRTLGELDTYGANADEFDVVSENCPELAPADGSTVTCSARIRFVPQAVGARTGTLRFANTSDSVTLQGNGIAAPQGPKGDTGNTGDTGDTGDTGAAGPKGDTGATGPKGDTGNTGDTGATGTAAKDGLDGKNGADGNDGAKGDKGDRGPRGVALKVVKGGKTKVGCKVTARRAGSRIVCQFNRRTGRNWLVQLRDSRGALSTANGNRSDVMVFLSTRKPRGAMHAFIIKGLPTS